MKTESQNKNEATPNKAKQMETTIVRTTWPQVRSHTVKGHVYWQCDCRRSGLNLPRKTFSLQSDALTYAASIAGKFANKGAQAFKAVDRGGQLEKWINALTPYGKTVQDAVDAYLITLKQQALVTKTTAEYLTDWQNEKLNNKMRPLRPASIRTLKARVSFFQEQFDGNLLGVVIEKNWLKNWFNSQDVSNETRKNYRRYLNDFVNWTVEQGLIASSPMKAIKIEDTKADIGIYTVEQVTAICKAAFGTQFQGFVSMLLFAGIRPNEASKLTWENVDFEHNEIVIPASVSKVKKERFVYAEKHGLQNLFVWLQNFKATGMPLVPDGFNPDTNTDWKAFKAFLGFFGQDFARHTFCTFHFAKLQSYESLKAICGTGDLYLRGNYQKAISSKTVESFWAITPESIKSNSSTR
jgi:integrase